MQGAQSEVSFFQAQRQGEDSNAPLQRSTQQYDTKDDQQPFLSFAAHGASGKCPCPFSAYMRCAAARSPLRTRRGPRDGGIYAPVALFCGSFLRVCAVALEKLGLGPVHNRTSGGKRTWPVYKFISSTLHGL